MVTQIPRSDRDRGQILLIAAIVIAFIVLGIVVVFNGVLYTNTISASETGHSVTEAKHIEYELERGLQAVANASYDEQESEFRREGTNQTITESDIASYVSSYANVTALGRPTVVHSSAQDIAVNHSAGTISANVTYHSTSVDRTVEIVVEADVEESP